MWVRSCQYLFQFLPYTFGADHMNIFGKLNNCPLCIFMDGKIKTARKTGGSYHAQLVLCKSFDGISGGADNTFRNVLLSADIIQYLILYGIVKQTIDGEVPPFFVIFGGAEGYIIQQLILSGIVRQTIDGEHPPFFDIFGGAEGYIIRVPSITVRAFRPKG